jgi:hypothetical protein
LKKLSPEFLKQFGLTGKGNYGAGGTGGNTPEYNRRVSILNLLSSEYAKKYPESRLIMMPGVQMPPVEWVNNRLVQEKESFRVELIKNNTDFFLLSIDPKVLNKDDINEK